MPESDDSFPRLLGGRYRLDAKLGSGGMGVVYRASDLTMHRSVAVKLIRGVDGVALDEEVAGRFLREAKNTARIQHEHIIEVFDLGRSEGGDMYFVMELLEGESLAAKLRREQRLEIGPGIHIIRQMCAGLHVAHTAGIVHRDLKPANVMLIHRAGDTDFVKVLDFGVAKSFAQVEDTQLTHTGMLVGTVEYMAPEQIMGRTVDQRTDIYALGCLMYRMFTGRPPFRDAGVPAMIHAHLNATPRPLYEALPDIPAALDHAVLRCLQKRPEERYDTMDELGQALAAVLPEPDHGFVSLEYGTDNDDTEVYGSDDHTEVGAPKALPDSGPTQVYGNRTAPMGRPSSFESRPRPPTPTPPDDRTEVMTREEVSTEKRHVPAELAHLQQSEPRACAMCRTLNPIHARACSACGVSLSAEDQDAVRARVTDARPLGPPPPPPMPPSGPVGYVAPYGPATPPQGMPTTHAQYGMQGVTWGGSPSQARSVQPSLGVWQRFLVWAGFRGR